MLNVKLEVFEGPFELLYKLIEKHKVDIYDIPIALIADSYVKEVETMENKNIDSIGEFLIMAATLLKIKSKLLLPKENEDEEEDDPRLELVERLLEYKKYKEVSEVLRELEEVSGSITFKPENDAIEEFKTKSIDMDEFLDGVDMTMLTNAFMNVMKGEKKPFERNLSEEIKEKTLRRNVYTIEKQMESLVSMIDLKNEIEFSELFSDESEKGEKIMSFLALLELIKSKYIVTKQDKIFGQIIISKVR